MKLLLYCCKAKPYLIRFGNEYGYNQFDTSYCKDEHISPYEWGSEILNGKIVAECDFEISIHNWYTDYSLFEKLYYQENMMFNNENSCMSSRELVSYLGNNDLKKDFYAIHIKNLHIFDEPYELGEALIYNFNTQYIVEKAPQNMMKVYNGAGECHILISIHPEWLCKILNGEKTIEVRKKVLKEML